MPHRSPGAARPDLARALADRPDAVAVLAVLHARGGAATLDELRRTCPSGHPVDAALWWLGAAGLVDAEPLAALSSGGSQRAVHALTDQGRRVAGSLAALAQALGS